MYEMRIYLLNNTGDYREGDEEYAGDWFNCPMDFGEVKEKLGVEHEEQIKIPDYDLPFDIHNDMPLWEINANCCMILEIKGTPVSNEIKAIREKWFDGFDDFIDHKDDICHYDVQDFIAPAQYILLEENLCGEMPVSLQNHIGYASFGHELETSDEYLSLPAGVFCYQKRGDVVSKK